MGIVLPTLISGKALRRRSPFRAYVVLAMSTSVFDDKDILIEVWKERRTAADAYVEMIWKGGQFYFVIISAIVSITFVGLGAYWQAEDSVTKLAYALTLSFLSVVILAFSWLGMTTAKRQFKRFLLMVAHVCKVEALLGFSDPVQDRFEKLDVFREDTYLFQTYTESYKGLSGQKKFAKETDWVESKVHEGPNTYTNIRNLYVLLIMIGLMLFVLDLSLIVVLF